MEEYTIQFSWVDLSGSHTESRKFTNIEDAVNRIYSMKRNNQIKQLRYEMLSNKKTQTNIVC